MATIEMTFTCFDCCQTYSGPVEYTGNQDDDQDAALRYITGKRRKDSQKGPICPKCLKLWRRSLSMDHTEQCLLAAKTRAEKMGQVVMVYSQHLRGKDKTAQGVWIRSDSAFQEIPREAKSNRPRNDAWKKLDLSPQHNAQSH